MKTDGYILTPELLQWRYFHRPVVVQVLIYVLLSATHNEASAATLSLRLLADRLHTSVKSLSAVPSMFSYRSESSQNAAPLKPQQ